MSPIPYSFAALASVFSILNVQAQEEQSFDEVRNELEYIAQELTLLQKRIEARSESKISASDALVIKEDYKLPTVSPEPKKQTDREKAMITLRSELEEMLRDIQTIKSRRNPLDPAAESQGFASQNLPSVADSLTATSTMETSGSSDTLPNGHTWLEGFYLLPFASLVVPDDLGWTTTLGSSFELEEENGWLLGLRSGYSQRHWFAEGELGWNRTKMGGSLEIPGFGLMSYDGKISGFSFLLSAGAKFNMGEQVAFLLGLGMGGMAQNIDFSLESLEDQKEGLLFAYQFFTGLVYSPSDHLLLGLRYRFVGVEELSFYSSRDLHLFELNAGYDF